MLISTSLFSVYKSTNMVRFDGIKSYYDFRQVTAEQLKTEAQKLMDVRKYLIQEVGYI